MSNVLDSLGRIKIVTSTGTIGGNVWPKADKLNIDTTEYSSVATAIAALLASQQLLVGEGSYTCSNQTISTSSFLHGAGIDVSIWTVANAASTLTLSATAFQMQDLTIQMTAGTTASAAALYCSGTDAILGFHNVKISQISAAGGTRYAALFDIQSNGIATLFDCVLIGDASGGGAVFALELDTGSINLYGGLVQGNVRVSGGTTLSLYGPRITGTITNSGTIKGWYFDTNGNLIVIDASGTTSGVWLIDEDLTLKTKEATLAAAITASASGDSIKLDTDTYSVSASQAITTSITIMGDGPEATVYTTSVSNDTIFDINADNITVVFKDITLKHTGGGVAATGIFGNNSGVTVVLDNAVVEISSGAGTASRGLWIESGTWILRNGAKIVVTSGTSKYAIYNDAGAVTVDLGAGCILNGATADIYSDQSGSTFNFDGVALLNNIMDCAGVVTGFCLDSKYRNAGFVALNNSGGTRAAGDVCDLGSDGKLTTTTTAAAPINWTVVAIGNTSANQCFVRKQGRVTVGYTSTAPNAGDYLTTSTSAGLAKQQTTMRPEIFAICTAGGSGGLVEALLLCGRAVMPVTSSNDIFNVGSASSSDFVSTISGAPSGTSVTYGAVSSGNENAINVAANTQLAKLILYNTTRGDSALISSVNTGTNVITLTATVPAAWANNDAITVRSQTVTDLNYYFDLQVTSSEVPNLAVALLVNAQISDTGAAGQLYRHHPFETGAASKRINLVSLVSSQATVGNGFILPLINRKFSVLWTGSGAGTATVLSRLAGYVLAVP